MKTPVFFTNRSRFVSSLIYVLLTFIFLLSNSRGEPNSCKEVKLKPIASQYGDPEIGASGSVCYVEESIDSWLVEVRLSGLTPEESYWLSINAGSPESRESEILGTLKILGWPPGNFYEHSSGKKEGYWDFMEIITDTLGNCEETITLPLPPGDYSVKFFVKKSYDESGRVVLHHDALTFEISEQRFGLILFIFLITVILLVTLLTVHRDTFKNKIKYISGLAEKALWPNRSRIPDDLSNNAPSQQSPMDRTACPYAFINKGDYWSITYEGHEIYVRDIKGMHYIHFLLNYPGKQFTCSNLLWNVEGGPQDCAKKSQLCANDMSSTDLFLKDPQLDEQAKVEYKKRLVDIESELDEAQRNNDIGRVQMIREEKEKIEKQLPSDIWPEGRTAGNIRVSITKLIHTAEKRIGKHSPELQRHLTETIKTGKNISYLPDPDNQISWKL